VVVIAVAAATAQHPPRLGAETGQLTRRQQKQGEEKKRKKTKSECRGEWRKRRSRNS